MTAGEEGSPIRTEAERIRHLLAQPTAEVMQLLARGRFPYAHLPGPRSLIAISHSEGFAIGRVHQSAMPANRPLLDMEQLLAGVYVPNAELVSVVVSSQMATVGRERQLAPCVGQR